jgi:hypothetical protein
MSKKLIYSLGILAVGIVTLIMGINVASAAVGITVITGSPVQISADTCAGAYTALTGPVLTESIAGELTAGTIELSTPTGFEFKVQAVTATIAPVGATGIDLGAGAGVAATTASPGASIVAGKITFTVAGVSTAASTITFSNIEVRPKALNCTVANTGSLTFAGTSTASGPAGTLTVIVGAVAKVAFTTPAINPSVSAAAFTTQPVVTVQDQFNNTETGDNASVITLTGFTDDACTVAVAGGTLTGTPLTKTAVGGVASFAGQLVQYSASGNLYLKATQTVGGAFTKCSLVIVVNPAAINNLVCASSGQAGTIYLSWTVPAGTTGYSAKYFPNIITTDGQFNAATDIAVAAGWGGGTVGQSVGSLLVPGLSPLATYFFSVKAKGADATLSTISAPLGVTCVAGGAASSNTSASQVSQPTSSITSPAAGASFKAETTITVTGTSSDSGVSSVKKVEVSTDGGTAWADATPLTSNSNYGFDWKYEWTGGGEGPHLLKSRATSWTGVVETPGAGISLTILSKSGIIYTGTSTAEQVVSQITSASSVAEIRAAIITLQTQLLNLLQQLLALLTAQLGH